MRIKLRSSLILWVAAIFLSNLTLRAESQSDSLSVALSSIVTGYLLEDMPPDTTQANEFIEGVISAKDSGRGKYYYYGGINGVNVVERIKLMKDMGLPIDDDIVFGKLYEMLKARNTGEYSVEQANKVINNYFAENILKVDTVSTESQREFIRNVSELPGAYLLPSGVVVIPLEHGNVTVQPVDGTRVMVSYEGRLSDGTVFDNTDTPIEMEVGTLVPGFNDALKEMHEGDKYRIVIPSDQGYGKNGIPGAIPGNSALDFTLKLDKIIN